MQNLAGVDPFGIVGQVLDAQFRVDRLVGEGGFSAVYRGHHIGLDEPIAIKCLKLPPSLSPQLVDQFAKRFRDESRILYRLSQGNLNIVRSMAGGTWQAPTGLLVPFMILEWMEGRSLANEFTVRRTTGNQGRSVAEVVKLFGSAADGLGYAHSQGVVHRDLNPGNLFLAATPQGTKMKVLDFGVAKILDDSTLNIGPRIHTVGQIRIFAPAYGAPEQFDDALGKVGAASDVYSFATILLEALRDRPVNDGTHIGEFAQRAIDPKVRPTPRTLGLEVSDEVEQIFARAVALDPRERWQSAGELWQALAIATSAASQQRHAQAAAETPPLAMPATLGRSTQTGMGMPPVKPRMDKTMPIGAVSPNLNLPGMQRPGTTPNAVPPPANVNVNVMPSHGAAEDEDEDVATRIGARAADTAPPTAENEDEVTRVRSPDADMLREFANADPRQAGGPPMTKHSPGPGAPPGPPATPGGHPDLPRAAGTLMMQPGYGQPPGQPPAQSPPLWGQPGPMPGAVPLGAPQPQNMQGQPPPPAPGAPHQQVYGQPNQHQHQQPYPPQGPPVHGQPVMPPGMPGQGQNPAYAAPQPHHPMESLPPAGVPKKGSGMMFVFIGLGVMLLVGVLGIAGYLISGKKDSTALGSSTVPASATSLAFSAPPPPPPPPVTVAATAEPPPAEVEAGAAAAEADNTPPPTPTPDTNPTPAPQPAPLPAPGPAPAPQPQPGPQPGFLPTPAVKDAGPPVDPNAFNESIARSRLSQANGVLVFCNKKGVTGPGTASVTFNPDGSVGTVSMDPPFAGTPAGDCVLGQFKRTKVPTFTGSPRTLKHSFDVPK